MIIYSISAKDTLDDKQNTDENKQTTFKIKIYKKPEVKAQMIIRDYNKQLEFSTFLDDE